MADRYQDRSDVGKQSLLLIVLGTCCFLGLCVILSDYFPLLLSLPAWLGFRFDGSIAIVLSSLAMIAVLYGASWARILLSLLLLAFGVGNLLAGLLFGPGVSWFAEQSRLPPVPSFMCVLVAIAALCDASARWGRVVWYMTAGLLGLLSLVVLAGQLLDSRPGVHMTSQGVAYCLSLAAIALVFARHPARPIAALSHSALIAGLFGAVVSMSWWFLGSWIYQQERIRDARAQLEQAAHAIGALTHRSEKLMQRQVMRRQQGLSQMSDGLWRNDVASYFRDTDALQALAFAETAGSNWQIEAARNASATDRLHSLATQHHVLDWLRDVRQTRKHAEWFMDAGSYPPWVLLQVTSDPGANEVMVAAFSLEALLQEALALIARPQDLVITYNGLRLRLADEISMPPTTARRAAPLARKEVRVDENVRLQLSVAPPPLPLVAPGNLLPLLGGIFGLILTHYLIVSRALLRRLNERGQSLAHSEQRFRSLFYQSPDAVFALDHQGHCSRLNDRAQKVLGVDEEAVLNRSMLDVINAEVTLGTGQRHEVEAFFRDTYAGKAGTHLISYRDGADSTRHFEISLLPIVVNNDIEGIYGIVRDVSRRMATEEQLRVLYRCLEASTNAVLVIAVRSMPAVVTYINPAFSSITGLAAERVVHLPAEQVMDALQIEAADLAAMRQAVAGGSSLSITLRNIREDGQIFWNHLVLSPVRDGDDILTHYIAILNDISERKEQESRLAYQATHDALTGLANRALFGDRLSHDCHLALRNGCCPVVLFIDLDEFKPINDTLGHRVGDEVLLSVARRLGECLRPSDTLARLGGDECVVLLPDIRQREEAEEIADRLLSILRRPYSVDGQELYLSASIGMAMLGQAADHSQRLVQQADMAMYRAKQQGRDTWQWFTPDMDEQITHRVSLRNELQEAMESNQLELHYQPLVRADGKPCGLEALLRWQHPERGSVSPAAFIPIAEETGQIIQLSEWVLQQACRDAANLHAEGLLPGRLAINLSPMQFHRPGFLSALQSNLIESGLPPCCLELELTEGILMRDTQGAIALLSALSEMGVQAVIDDFGTGFSSLSYIRMLPVHKIKIDGSFVAGILDNDKDAAVCKAVIALARELGLAVVAECVETSSQLDCLVAHGCEMFQGYHFARPMPLDNLVQWLAAIASRP